MGLCDLPAAAANCVTALSAGPMTTFYMEILEDLVDAASSRNAAGVIDDRPCFFFTKIRFDRAHKEVLAGIS
jgi:hypothetical protein